QIVSENYIKEATTAAKDLKDEFGNFPLNYYGYQWWILHINDLEIPYMRGHKGQYIYSIPEKNAIVVRLGEERDKENIGEISSDILEYINMAFPLLR
ncbi:MAG: serine hydrolase, partial [Bacteroidia bacterium]